MSGILVLAKRGLFDMAHDVFISYSADDKPIADAMCSTLELKGIRCWIAPRDIRPGMDWGSSIIDAIATSRVMVLLLSSHSNTSIQVKREVERAVNKEITVIPFRIEDVSLSKSLEYQLSLTHWMDALTPPMEKHLQTLSESILQLLAIDDSMGHTPIKEKAMSVQPAPSSRKRRALYLGAGLVISLIMLVGLVWWLGRSSSKPESVTTVPTLDSSISAFNSKQNNLQKQIGNNQTQSSNSDESNTGGQLRIPVIIESSYDVARELLIREGWQPYKKQWSYGEDPKVQSGNGPLFWKRGYWELESCSGTGLAECSFEFIDPHKRVLIVITNGEEADNGEYHAIVKQAVFKEK